MNWERQCWLEKMGVASLFPAPVHFLHHLLLNDCTTILELGTGCIPFAKKNKNFLSILQSFSQTGTKALPLDNIMCQQTHCLLIYQQPELLMSF